MNFVRDCREKTHESVEHDLCIVDGAMENVLADRRIKIIFPTV